MPPCWSMLAIVAWLVTEQPTLFVTVTVSVTLPAGAPATTVPRFAVSTGGVVFETEHVTPAVLLAQLLATYVWPASIVSVIVAFGAGPDPVFVYLSWYSRKSPGFAVAVPVNPLPVSTES